MKIVYCIKSLHPSGGTERVLTTKMNFLAEHTECSVYVILQDEQGAPFFQLSPKVHRISLRVKGKRDYRIALEQTLISLRPDVTVCVGGQELSFINDLKDGSKKVLEFHYTKNFLVNFVKGIRRIPFKSLHLLKVWLIQKRLAHYVKKFDLVVGLTARDVQLWGSPVNMTYVYNPLSFRSSVKSTTQNKEIISVGSFTPAKGMDLLVEAFGRIALRYPDWRLSIYGSGQDYNLLKELIAQYHIESQVSLYEPVRNIGDKMVESSIYAFPSRSDGFGLVLTEAMECGLPCVAFDCECGPREILSPDTGILVPPQDINGFAHALARLMDSDSLRKNMGERAAEEVSRFYPENIMPRWLELFNKLVKNSL
ncbi:hypothetical protein BARVI_00390 [Barnesiella viscericola DSM 18177]|uniref:Glycosyl transferase family 1 domain-containing protein n=1 Tax=Barnesiella viscericola DSM 18177 TaxID=880074 RepID=W0EWS2_9BACT|nr:glycosyltransferase family 4 protein [Barnesiella viscericola]AHF13526.1 hypothetical protein BARVI_00390 [Barnesiella viscericola DSM 18177]